MNDLKYVATMTDSGDAALSVWRWLTGPDLQLRRVTKVSDPLLRDPADGSVHFLDTVAGQAALGMRPGTNACLSSKRPSALGGSLGLDNFETCSIPVRFSITGQISGQIKDLPPGTPITDIKLQPPGGSVRRTW